MHIKWPTVILILGIGFISLGVYVVAKMSSLGPRPAKVDYYQTGTVEILNIHHVDRYPYHDVDVLTVMDAGSRHVWLLYLCSEIPKLPADGSGQSIKAVFRYDIEVDQETGCHKLQTLTLQ